MIVASISWNKKEPKLQEKGRKTVQELTLPYRHKRKLLEVTTLKEFMEN
jgi:hypothetical protein